MMHHTQIAQRVFNTPLMVDPAKALAFLTGLYAAGAALALRARLRGLLLGSLRLRIAVAFRGRLA